MESSKKIILKGYFLRNPIIMLADPSQHIYVEFFMGWAADKLSRCVVESYLSLSTVTQGRPAIVIIKPL